MPLYDTICTACGREKTLAHKITAEHPPCTLCGGKLKTLLSAVAGKVRGGTPKHYPRR